MTNDTLLEKISIATEHERAWLIQCRKHNATLGRSKYVDAVDRRLRDLDFQKAVRVRPEGNTLEARVFNSVTVYRAFLKRKHGRNQAAGYTEREIRQKGARGALIDTVLRGKSTAGLLALAELDRLDCSYEQIAVDFASELPDEVVAKARDMLARFQDEAQRQAAAGSSAGGTSSAK